MTHGVSLSNNLQYSPASTPQYHSAYGKRGPHSLPTPPASQPQPRPNGQTHALNTPPQFDPISSVGRALQTVPPNGHIVTDPSSHIKLTAKQPRDPNTSDREKCRDDSTSLHPSNPIHVSSPPAPQTKGVVIGLTLPELSETLGEQLAALIEFG